MLKYENSETEQSRSPGTVEAEALDFTKWLSEPDNLELLSDEIGIGIELVQTEAHVEELLGSPSLFKNLLIL